MKDHSPVGIVLGCDEYGCWCTGFVGKSRACTCTKCHGAGQLLNWAPWSGPLWDGTEVRDKR